jgi:hypothetical protein
VCRQTDSGVPGVGGGAIGPADDDWRAAPHPYCPVRYQAGPVRTSSGTAVRGGNLINPREKQCCGTVKVLADTINNCITVFDFFYSTFFSFKFYNKFDETYQFFLCKKACYVKRQDVF